MPNVLPGSRRSTHRLGGGGPLGRSSYKRKGGDFNRSVALPRPPDLSRRLARAGALAPEHRLADTPPHLIGGA
jgi:hypothetical protein